MSLFNLTPTELLASPWFVVFMKVFLCLRLLGHIIKTGLTTWISKAKLSGSRAELANLSSNTSWMIYYMYNSIDLAPHKGNIQDFIRMNQLLTSIISLLFFYFTITIYILDILKCTLKPPFKYKVRTDNENLP